MKDLRQNCWEKSQKIFARRAQEKATPAKANVETKAAPKPMSMPAGPKAPAKAIAKAPAKEPAFPRSKPTPKAPAPAGAKPMPVPVYHNVGCCTILRFTERISQINCQPTRLHCQPPKDSSNIKQQKQPSNV